MNPARSGSALPMVLAFVLILFVAAGGSAFQSSGSRKLQARSYYNYLATEIAMSAIDEAASDLTLDKVIDPTRYGTATAFMESIRDNKPPQGIPAASIDWRTITYTSGKAAEKLLSVLSFPDSPIKIKTDSSATRNLHQKNPLFKDLSDVTVRPLRFRRENFPSTTAPYRRWVNWGVIQFSVKAKVGLGAASATREVLVDRVFKLRARNAATAGSWDWELDVAQRNQRTIVRE